MEALVTWKQGFICKLRKITVKQPCELWSLRELCNTHETLGNNINMNSGAPQSPCNTRRKFRRCSGAVQVRAKRGHELSYLLQMEGWRGRGKWSEWDRDKARWWSKISRSWGREAARGEKWAWAGTERAAEKTIVQMKASIVSIWAWRPGGSLQADKEQGEQRKHCEQNHKSCGGLH